MDEKRVQKGVENQSKIGGSKRVQKDPFFDLKKTSTHILFHYFKVFIKSLNLYNILKIVNLLK